jgi:hypothetical protein
MSRDPYLLNLTNHLITKHRLGHYKVPDAERIAAIDQVQGLLMGREITAMSAETLGKIMGSFENGDVDAFYDDLVEQKPRWNGLWLNGGSGIFLLQKLASRCLAYVIVDRIRGRHLNLPACSS